jgi:hypothetical protein
LVPLFVRPANDNGLALMRQIDEMMRVDKQHRIRMAEEADRDAASGLP